MAYQYLTKIKIGTATVESGSKNVYEFRGKIPIEEMPTENVGHGSHYIQFGVGGSVQIYFYDDETNSWVQ